MEKSELQKFAEAKVEDFKDDLGPFVVAAETTRMAMAFTDAKRHGNPIIFANDRFLELTGYSRDELLGRDFSFLLAHGDNRQALAKIELAFNGSSRGSSVEDNYKRRDGTEFWAALFVSPVRDEHDVIVQYFASLVDLTSHREHETQLKKLIDEMNHRVKNTLATVQSIVRHALRDDADPKQLRETIQSRLFALSCSHDLLTRESWKSAELEDIIGEALEPFVTSDSQAGRIVTKGTQILFPPRSTLAFAIAFNELATNAVKYGSLSGTTGSVLIEWHVEPSAQGRNLVMVWKESGGPRVVPPTRQGFGSRMIERGLAVELGGVAKLDYLPDGLVCTLTVSVP